MLRCEFFSLGCFCIGQLILSETELCGDQEGHLVRHGGFSKAPGGKDFSKMKTQYVMFVDTVTSKQVCVSESP